MKKSDVTDLSSLIGQPEAASRLAAIIADPGATFHLITGAPGSGKRFAAQILAKAVLCESPGPSGACGACRSCTLFDAGNQIDFHELKPDSKTLIKTDTVRQAINDLHVMPRLGERQVILIDGNLLNEQGQNALLKSLETPPPSVIFIMTADSEQALLPTIRSRAGTIALTARDDRSIRQILKLHGIVAEDAVSQAVAYAAGNPGRALTLAGSKSFPVVREVALKLFFGLPKRRVSELLSEDAAVLKQYKESDDQELDTVFDIWSEQLRDALVMHLGREPLHSTEKKRLADFLAETDKRADTAARLERCQREIIRVRRALAAYAGADTALAHILLFMGKELHG